MLAQGKGRRGHALGKIGHAAVRTLSSAQAKKLSPPALARFEHNAGVLVRLVEICPF